jgi:DNA-binding NtrC family response regulator
VLERTPAILVVDGCVEARADVTGLLLAAGYEVIGAASFEEARDHLSRDVPDLMITELRLGGFNGLQLVMRARVRHRIPTIVATAFHDPVLAAEAELQQAAYLVKPMNSAELLTLVGELLAGRCPSPRRSAGAIGDPFNRASAWL